MQRKIVFYSSDYTDQLTKYDLLLLFYNDLGSRQNRSRVIKASRP